MNTCEVISVQQRGPQKQDRSVLQNLSTKEFCCSGSSSVQRIHPPSLPKVQMPIARRNDRTSALKWNDVKESSKHYQTTDMCFEEIQCHEESLCPNIKNKMKSLMFQFLQLRAAAFTIKSNSLRTREGDPTQMPNSKPNQNTITVVI